MSEPATRGKGRKVKTNVVPAVFDNTLNSFAQRDGTTGQDITQLFMNYVQLCGDLFALTLFTAMTVMKYAYVEEIFDMTRKRYISADDEGEEDEDAEGEEEKADDASFKILIRKHPHVDMCRNLFVKGHEEFVARGRPTEFEMAAECEVKSHTHTFLCALTRVLENPRPKLASHRDGDGLFASYVADMYELCSIRDGDAERKLRRAPFYEPVMELAYGYNPSKKFVGKLKKLTLSVETGEERVVYEDGVPAEVAADQDVSLTNVTLALSRGDKKVTVATRKVLKTLKLADKIQFFIELREFAEWGIAAKDNMYSVMQENKRGSSVYKFNLLTMDCYQRHGENWDYPPFVTRLKIKRDDSDAQTPRLHHILAARAAIDAGEYHLLERWTWLMEDDAPTSPCSTVSSASSRCSWLSSGSSSSRKSRESTKKVVIVKRSLKRTPDRQQQQRQRRKDRSASKGSKRLRPMTYYEIEQFIRNHCKFSSNTFLFFSKDTLEAWDREEVTFRMTYFARSPQFELNKLLLTFVKRNCTTVFKKAENDAASLLGKITLYEVWDTEWNPSTKIIAVSCRDVHTIGRRYEGILCYVAAVNPLKIIVISSMEQLVSQLSTFGGNAITSDQIMNKNPGNVEAAVWQTKLCRSATRCKVIQAVAGPGHAGEYSPNCCIWSIFDVHGYLFNRETHMFEKFGALNYDTRSTEMTFAADILYMNKYARNARNRDAAFHARNLKNEKEPVAMKHSPYRMLISFVECGCMAIVVTGELKWDLCKFVADEEGAGELYVKDWILDREKVVPPSYLTSPAATCKGEKVPLLYLLRRARAASVNVDVHDELREHLGLRNRRKASRDEDSVLDYVEGELYSSACTVPVWVFVQVLTFWTCLACPDFSRLVPIYALRNSLSMFAISKFCRDLMFGADIADFAGRNVYAPNLIKNVLFPETLAWRHEGNKHKVNIIGDLLCAAWNRVYTFYAIELMDGKLELHHVKPLFAAVVDDLGDFMRNKSEVRRFIVPRIDIIDEDIFCYGGMITLEEKNHARLVFNSHKRSS